MREHIDRPFMTPVRMLGKDIPAGALNGITRESIDNVLIKGHGEFGETLERKSLNISL